MFAPLSFRLLVLGVGVGGLEMVRAIVIEVIHSFLCL